MVDIQSVAAEIRRRKKERKKKEITGQKYNGGHNELRKNVNELHKSILYSRDKTTCVKRTLAMILVVTRAP